MNYSKEICKVTDNQIVFPIKDYENIGDSLSSINYNFNALDVYTCNFEYSANNIWNQIFNSIATNSASWTENLVAVTTNSAAWSETYTSVSQLSSIWLKPISLVYPYPFSDDANIISDILTWVNDNFPVVSNLCSNFVIGQELYIFTPLYKEINRIVSTSINLGKKETNFKLDYTCIGSGWVNLRKTVVTDCGDHKIDIEVPDKYISSIAGLKFTINPEKSEWQYDSPLYN